MTADDALTPQARRELEAMEAALAGRPVEPELTELGVLALALRDGRPQPRPAFTRDLDARAAAGFPRPRRLGALRQRFPSSMLLVPGTVLAAVAALAVTVAIVASSGPPGGGSAGSSAAGGESAAPSTVPGAAGGGSAGSDGRRQRFVERSAT